jgi:predicted transcriptional regulator
VTTVTPLELAILRSLWRRGQATVREVQADLAAERPLAYTTVMTVLDRLFRKGLTTRTRRSRAHVYEPAVAEARLRSDALAGLLDTWFGGDPVALRAFLETGDVPAPGPNVSDGVSDGATDGTRHLDSETGQAGGGRADVPGTEPPHGAPSPARPAGRPGERPPIDDSLL